MKFFYQKLAIFFVAISLVLMPMELLAAKKSRVHARTSHKTSAVHAKYRGAKLSRAGKMQLRLRQIHLAKLRQEQAIRARQEMLGENYDGSGVLQLASSKALIINQKTGEVVYAKNTNMASPIASITKLMTAMVMLDAKLSLDETIYVSEEDIDYLKGTSSRLMVGSGLPRGDMLQLALMASENRAASAISHNYPGGQRAFIQAMNNKAAELEMTNTRFYDATGLNSDNVSTAEDLVKMVHAAYQYPEIRLATTSPSHEVYLNGREYPTNFNNTNSLVRTGEWQIGLSKTGYISEAGRCLVMQALIVGEPMIMVFLDSNGKLSRIGDANRVRKWMEFNNKPTKTGQQLEAAKKLELAS